MNALFADPEPISQTTFFAEIILPLAVGQIFTYRIPQEFLEEIIPGKRVMVPFGKNKVYSAMVYKTHQKAPIGYEAKYLLSVLDAEPIITVSHLDFWLWISEYYLCHIGEVMRAALPSGLKLESESVLVVNEELEGQGPDLSEKEQIVMEVIRTRGSVSLEALAKAVHQRSVASLVHSLIGKKAVLIREEVGGGYRPKKESFVKIKAAFDTDAAKRELFTQLDHSPAQLNLLMIYYSQRNQHQEVSKSGLLAQSGSQPSTLTAMEKKGIFEVYHKRVSRLTSFEVSSKEFELSPAQKLAYEEIKHEFERRSVVLLHGVTSSGKTQLYFRLIEEYLAEGKQVLYLLPEIALTAQLVNRLREQFGGLVGIYHSHFNENERVETWENVLHGTFKIVIGARSALFLPFQHLGFIIIDEEHEPSFKQYDPAPRYHARDCAIYLGVHQKAHVLLGSATPSIESYYLALQDKYGLVTLKERYGGVPMPDIHLVDLARETREKTVHHHFSSALIEQIRKALGAKEQIILFQNRRGYAPLLLCSSCGFIPRCVRCDVSLTFHKNTQKLHCHYCGYSQSVPAPCPVCGHPILDDKGLGTEKIEEEVQELFPGSRTARMDLDTTRGKNGHWKILSQLEQGLTDILVGTQMVSKGLDFGKVQLVGVLNADQILNFPDFRAFERGFQVLTQVSGRAGRRSTQGQVIIQTYSPKHPILALIRQGDYLGLYALEIQEREKFQYPPFTRIIQLSCKNADLGVLHQTTAALERLLRANFGDLVLGPEDALVSRVRNQYIRQFMIKLPRRATLPFDAKRRLTDLIRTISIDKTYRSTNFQVDVDPA